MAEVISTAPPPPPPPPPPPSETITTCLETIIPYPSLLRHEESLSAQASGTYGAYDVTSWMSYLTSMDDALDILGDAYHSLTASDGNNKQSRGGGGQRQAVQHVAHTTTVQAAGRTFRISSAQAPGITHTLSSFRKEINEMVKARIVVGERSVALLPGSYKLWKNHLLFCTELLEQSSANYSPDRIMNSQFKAKCNLHRLPPYLITSSAKHSHYELTSSAYRRSLVTMHKMPSIWLHYASFTALYDPARNPTNVRHIYDSALVALPASQHDRIWEDYLCWVTGMLPGVSGERGNKKGGDENNEANVVARAGRHKVKYGFESPLVAQWRRRGWGYHQIVKSSDDINTAAAEGMKEEYQSTVPTETAMRILRRHSCYDATYREDLASLCISRYARYGEAASLMLQLLNNEGGEFLSPNGTTRHELWLRFADVCTGHPDEARVAGVDFDGIVRAVLMGRDAVTVGGGGVGSSNKGGGDGGWAFEVFDNTINDDDEGKEREKKSSNQALNHRLGEMEGTLWTRLAEYHVRAGNFELARSVYEEALDAITRVRDFSLVFDAYVKFEEGVIEALMELMEEEEEEEEAGNEEEEEAKKGGEDDDDDLDILLGGDNAQTNNAEGGEGSASADVELAISRAEHLTSRRPLLLNRVLLRQNPHNVGEWIKRSQLYLELNEVDLAATALEESLKSVSARKAVNGSPSTLVLTLIDILENKQKNVNAARSVLERICTNSEYEFGDSDDLAQCHAAWVELELRQENWDGALELARRATSGRVGGKTNRAAKGLSRSLRLWNLLFDLEESLGTVQTTKGAYDRAIEMKVATPSHVLNYANFLRDKKYFEESFSAYERGIGLFLFPHAGAKLLWKNYLTHFLERYPDGSKTPRVRELFDRCLADCPPEESPEFYLLYGQYEETHGLTKRALSVYERMCNSVPTPSEKYTAYRLYIAKAIQYLGVTSARPIYEAAISALDDSHASRICLEYAKMETGLREVDRARTVLVYGAQLADPRRDPDYWKAWHEFEVSHGNEETFREMLRVKRGVQAAFSTVNYNAAEMGGGTPKVDTLSDEAALEMIAEREGLDDVVGASKKPLIGGFVSGKDSSKKRSAEMADLGEVERRAAKLREVTAQQTAAASDVGGDDEIDIDDEEEEEKQMPAPPPPASTNVKAVSERTVPAAVFGGLATSSDQQ